MPTEVTICVKNRGPLIVQGPVRIVDTEGHDLTPTGDKPTIALCACGQSKTMPFCDGAHKACND